MDQLLANPYIIPGISVFLAVYGGAVTPALPPKVLAFLRQPFAQFLFLFAIAYIVIGVHNVKYCAVAAALVMIVAAALLRYFGGEGFDWENTDIYPGCLNVTWQEIYNSFGGDKEKMRAALFNYVNTNYTSAPLAATQLINKGHYINPVCKIN